MAVAIANAELAEPITLVPETVNELGSSPDELRVKLVDVVEPEVDVEHVRRRSIAVRSRSGAHEAGEMDVAAVPPRVSVVLRDPVVGLDLEAEGVAAVRARPPDVLDEQHRRVPRQRHARIIAQWGGGSDCSANLRLVPG
jgi:hypothetical protein